MSFNIQGHGPGSAEHRMGKEKWENQIIDVIKQSGAKIVLLQEVPLYPVPNNLAQSFVNKLNLKSKDWKYTSSVSYSTSSMDLNNAVLYNEKYVTLVNDLAYKSPLCMYEYATNVVGYEEIQEDPRKFKFIKNNEQILEFSFRDLPSQTFLIVNVHLPGPDETEKKIEERQQLEALYNYYRLKKAIVIAGDFNISRRDLIRSSFGNAIIDGIDGRYSDFWGQKTTVTEDISSITLNNDYDHFIVSKNQFFSVSEQMHHVYSKEKKEKYDEIRIGKNSYKNSFEYHRGLSDHIPIMIKLEY